MGFKRLLYIGCTTMLLLGIGVMQGLLPWFVLLLVLLAMLAIVAAGASRIGSGFFLRATTHFATKEKKIALTFDDGPQPEYTLAVADLLERYGARATFFCIGSQVLEHPETATLLYKRGHQVANHSFSHSKWIDFKSKRGWLQEIRQADEAIQQVTNEKNKLFRPPYGVTTPHLAAAIHETGHQVIGWQVRPFDTTEADPERITSRVLKKVKPGDIVLLHDTHPRIIPALERLLPILIQDGYKMVTVEKLACDV